jgi:hypothetical protein
VRLYHFTAPVHLPEILRTRVLRVTESNGALREPHAKPDVVWLLDEPDAAGASHGLVHPDPEIAAEPMFDKRRVRFTVEVPDYRVERWVVWAARHGVDALTQAIIVETGGGIEAAKHWWVSERPIPSKWWTGVAIDGQEGEF